jgi:uncharacterized protein
MKFHLLCIYTCLLSLSTCGQYSKEKKENMSTPIHKYTNNLINETSPYLLQHAHNPVNWYPWGEEALTKAKNENKLIIVSIGYAACHWCHVMEHESFENEEVASLMNDNFICIKIDREERPDIDQVYMNAVQLISGRGGWPLNCITLPDGRPIYGGTYYPPNNWTELLTNVSKFVKESPERAENQAKELTNGINSSEFIMLNHDKPQFSTLDLDRIFTNFEQQLDPINGGNKGAPKFPMPIGHEFLLHYNYIMDEPAALDATMLTLKKMANGGIYDQIGGGFSRYSTDAYWKAPHFEKMLYDNGQLVSLYSSAFQVNRNPLFKTIIEETLDFTKRELTSKDGGFYSSLDADSEGIEGKFYVWKQEELTELLKDDAELIIEYYNSEKKGNWENGENILLKTKSNKTFATEHQLSEKELEKKVSKAKEILMKERASRIRPALDDKILTSWNALMLKGYIDAYKILDKKEYLTIALKNAEFICNNLKFKDHRLNRNFKNGKATINGFLDDYAFTIQAFIALYQVTFEDKWLKEAENLMKYSIDHFYDEKNGMFYYTSDIDPSLIARKMEVSDNVIPSSNSEMAKNLFLIGRYTYNDSYTQMSQKMLNNVKENTIKGGSYYANWSILLSWFSSETYDVSIVGEDCHKIRKEFDQKYLPNIFISGGKKEGESPLLKDKLIPNETTIYVCQDKACKLPVNTYEKALKQINK